VSLVDVENRETLSNSYLFSFIMLYLTMTKRKDPTVQRKKGGMDWPRGALTYLPLGHLTCNEILHWAKMQNIMCTCARTFSLSVGGGALPQSPIRALSLDHIRGLPTPCSRSCPSCIKWQ